MTKGDVLEVILGAAEQHGAEDVDDPRREVKDLRLAITIAVDRVMTRNQAQELASMLERHGMLAGWL